MDTLEGSRPTRVGRPGPGVADRGLLSTPCQSHDGRPSLSDRRRAGVLRGTPRSVGARRRHSLRMPGLLLYGVAFPGRAERMARPSGLAPMMEVCMRTEESERPITFAG